MLQHSPPLPLIVHIQSIYRRDITQSTNNIVHALQYPDRVVSISVDTWVVDPRLFTALDKTFPELETFSLVVGMLESPDREFLFFPQNFSAPHLRSLYLKNVNIFEAPSLLTSVGTSLVSLHIEQIEEYSYLSPDELVGCISSMPQLEKLFIHFIAGFRLADIEGELWGTQTGRTVLPNLMKLTFGGDSAYLDKLLALISTPLLQCFDVEFFCQPTLVVQHIPEFLSTIQNLDFRALAVSFSDTVAITYRPTQTSSSLSYVMFRIEDETDRLNQQVTTVIQVCATVGPALDAVEDVALEFDRCYVPDDFAVRSELWRTFLRAFQASRTLRTDVALVPDIFKVFNPDNGTAAEELLPLLSELVVVSRIDLTHNPFASLIHARSLVGPVINFQVIKRRGLPPRTFTPGHFDALYERYDTAMPDPPLDLSDIIFD